MTFRLPALTNPLQICDSQITQVTTHQYLGVWFDSRLTFRPQVRYLIERALVRLSALHHISGRGSGASVKVKRNVYTAAIRSIIDYCAPCLAGLSDNSFNSLEVIQNEPMRTILGAP